MERHPHADRRADPALSPEWINRFAKDSTEAFRQMMSAKRMEALTQARSVPQQQTSVVYDNAGIPQPPPQPNALPSYSSLRNIPMMPQPPQANDTRALRFRHMLNSLANLPKAWENPGLLDEALSFVPLERIYGEAEEESQILQAEAASLGKKPRWGYQDCVIRALMKWFKQSFFTWVDNPVCQVCAHPTICVGKTPPSAEETAHSATLVEMYQCSNQMCRQYTRFPRYNNAMKLLQTRKGRCGEWNNAFGFLCRALSSRVRWVWNSEDHVWLEVYSEHRKLWVHVDVCEGRWDMPRLYAEGMLYSIDQQAPLLTFAGWGKKLGYCIAFSRTGAVDVTRRYVRNAMRYGLNRTKCSEPVLMYILQEITRNLRRDMSKNEKFVLNKEDMAEEELLRDSMRMAVAQDICQLRVADILAGYVRTEPNKVSEVLDARTSGSLARNIARGEAGPRNPPPR